MNNNRKKAIDYIYQLLIQKDSITIEQMQNSNFLFGII